MKKQNKVKPIGVWPLKTISNPRNRIMYSAIENISQLKFCDLKTFPLRAFSCDLVHLHWPDRVLLDRSLIKIFILAIYLFSLRIFRIKVLQTLHNDPASFHCNHPYLWLYRALVIPNISFFIKPSMAVSGWNEINQRTLDTIPLGLYPKSKNISDHNSLKYYGMICGRLTKKKGIIEQLKKINSLDSFFGKSFLICGKPESKIYLQEILKTIKQCRNINIAHDFRYILEDELDSYFAQTKNVFLINKYITNSGVFTKAIGMGVAVITDSHSLVCDAEKLYGCQIDKLQDLFIIRPPKGSESSSLRIDNLCPISSIASKYVELYKRLKI